jgi:hypothetical protein
MLLMFLQPGVHRMSHLPDVEMGDMIDTVLHKDVQMLEIIVSDILNSDHLPSRFPHGG